MVHRIFFGSVTAVIALAGCGGGGGSSFVAPNATSALATPGPGTAFSASPEPIVRQTPVALVGPGATPVPTATYFPAASQTPGSSAEYIPSR